VPFPASDAARCEETVLEIDRKKTARVVTASTGLDATDRVRSIDGG